MPPWLCGIIISIIQSIQLTSSAHPTILKMFEFLSRSVIISLSLIRCYWCCCFCYLALFVYLYKIFWHFVLYCQILSAIFIRYEPFLLHLLIVTPNVLRIYQILFSYLVGNIFFFAKQDFKNSWKKLWQLKISASAIHKCYIQRSMADYY